MRLQCYKNYSLLQFYNSGLFVSKIFKETEKTPESVKSCHSLYNDEKYSNSLNIANCYESSPELKVRLFVSNRPVIKDL